jgi:hypothetical protein
MKTLINQLSTAGFGENKATAKPKTATTTKQLSGRKNERRTGSSI